MGYIKGLFSSTVEPLARTVPGPITKEALKLLKARKLQIITVPSCSEYPTGPDQSVTSNAQAISQQKGDVITEAGNAGDLRVVTFGAQQGAVEIFKKRANELSVELTPDHIRKILQIFFDAGKSKVGVSIHDSNHIYIFDLNEISETIQKQPQKMFTNFLRGIESTLNNRTIDNKKSNSSGALEKASKIAIKKSKRTSKNTFFDLKNRLENIEELSSIRIDTSKPLVNDNSATTSEDNSQLKSGGGKRDLQSESLTLNNIAISSLHYAARMGYTQKVKDLIEQVGADINERDKYGCTPLHYASARKYNEETVQFLLNRGAKFDEKNDVGMTPLCFAIVNDCERIVKILVEKGADVNVISRSGNTPLHWLVISRHTWDDLCSSECAHKEIEDFLLNNGANPLLRNNDGQTPEDLAKKNENFRQRKDSTSSKGNKQPSSSVSAESEDNKKTGIQFLQEESNESTSSIQSAQKGKWPVVVPTTLAIAGVASGVVIAVYLEMLAVGIALGACCLVAAAIVYYCNQPPKSLESSNAQMVNPEKLKTSCCAA